MYGGCTKGDRWRWLCLRVGDGEELAMARQAAGMGKEVARAIIKTGDPDPDPSVGSLYWNSL